MLIQNNERQKLERWQQAIPLVVCFADRKGPELKAFQAQMRGASCPLTLDQAGHLTPKTPEDEVKPNELGGASGHQAMTAAIAPAVTSLELDHILLTTLVQHLQRHPAQWNEGTAETGQVQSARCWPYSTDDKGSARLWHRLFSGQESHLTP